MVEQRKPLVESLASALASSVAPELETIQRAMEVLHVQLVSQETAGHMQWFWDGHDEPYTDRRWPTREEAVRYMSEILARREPDR